MYVKQFDTNKQTTQEIINDVVAKYQEELIGEQKEALADIVEWYFDLDQEQDNVLIFTGAAGCGKTYVLVRIVKAIKEIHKQIFGYKKIKIAACAPTHKAIGVIDDNFADENIHSCTVHSLLRLVPKDYDAKGNQLLVPTKSTQPCIGEFNLIMHDETSMADELLCGTILKSTYNNTLQIPISDLLIQHCRRIGNKDTKVLFVGDDYQLPPVRKSDDEEASKGQVMLSPVFATTKIRKIILTEPVRYSGAIAEYATAIRKEINSLKMKFPEKGNNIEITPTEQWEIDFFESLKANPLTTRALAWTNVRVSSLADKARQYIHKDNEPFHIGEILTAKELVCLDATDERGRPKKEILMHSCQDAQILNMEILRIKIDIPSSFTTQLNKFIELDVYEMNLKRLIDNVTFKIYTPTVASLDKVVKPFLKVFKQDILDTEPQLRGVKWAQYYSLLDYLTLSMKGNAIIYRLQFAGVLSVHQSQGSGYPIIFGDILNIYGCKNFAMRNRLLYTMITRAKEQLIVNCKLRPENKDCDSDESVFFIKSSVVDVPRANRHGLILL